MPRLRRLNRLAAVHAGHRLRVHDGGRWAIRDFAMDNYVFDGSDMFKFIRVGMIVWIETFSFPMVGRVEDFDDSQIMLRDAVKVLYDGRHGEFCKGAKKVPSNAEIEKTIPLLTISTDDCRAVGEYPGSAIPEPQ